MIDGPTSARRASISASVILIAVILGYIAGYRPFGAGFDFYQYWYFYNRIGPFSNLSDFRFEPGFVLIAKISSQIIGLNYFQFAAAISAICLIVKFRSLEGLESFIPALMFYLCVYFPLHENTQIRIALAISVLFFSTRYLFSENWLKFAIASALAVTFHTTAIIASVSLISCYFLSKFHIGYGIAIAVIISALMSSFLGMILSDLMELNPLLENSLNISINPNVFSITNIFTVAFLFFYILSGSARDRRSKTFFLVSCFGISAFLGLYAVPVMAHRIKELLLVFMTFIAFEYRWNNKTYPQAALAIVLAIGSLYGSIITGFFSD